MHLQSIGTRTGFLWGEFCIGYWNPMRQNLTAKYTLFLYCLKSLLNYLWSLLKFKLRKLKNNDEKKVRGAEGAALEPTLTAAGLSARDAWQEEKPHLWLRVPVMSQTSGGRICHKNLWSVRAFFRLRSSILNFPTRSFVNGSSFEGFCIAVVISVHLRHWGTLTEMSCE